MRFGSTAQSHIERKPAANISAAYMPPFITVQNCRESSAALTLRKETFCFSAVRHHAIRSPRPFGFQAPFYL